MRRLKKIMQLLLMLMLMACVLSGCSETEEEQFALSVCVGDAPASLDPVYAEELADQTALIHLYENLMRIATDENGNTVVANGMARSVEHVENLDGTVTFTFKLRDAEWSDGRDVTASDFVYAWRRLASPTTNSPYAELLSLVVGYEEARASNDMTLLHVTAKNDTTLVVDLTGHYDWFISQVCTAPATLPLRQDCIMKLKEAAGEAPWWSKPEKLVTNGMYRVESYDPDKMMVLAANEDYDEKPDGPDEICFRFTPSEGEAWSLYEMDVVDMVWPMSDSRVRELLETEPEEGAEAWTPTAELGVHTVLFNGNHPLVGDPLFRQALSMVVDRNALAELAGIMAQPAEGLVPHGVPENEEGDFRTAGGPLLDNAPEDYDALCIEARVLLSQTGYRDQDLEFLYKENGTNGMVAQALCQQWQNILQIRVLPRGVTEAELWTVLRSGEYTLAGVELDAVGNDAECFLMPWTSGSQDNVIGYSNSAYDTLMSIIAGAADGAARLGCLHDAEVLLLSDYALLPVYTHGVAWEMRDTLTGLARDARGWFSFSGVTRIPTE